jgi:riboflavin synthase
MFSGIIEAKVRVRAVHPDGANKRVTFVLPKGWKFKKGDSVSVDGICSTVVKKTPNTFEVEYMPETLRVSTAKDFTASSEVNLERSLKLGNALHGHFVQAHVDAKGTIVAADGNELTIRVQRDVQRLVAQKGSVALNGVSLTVAKKERDTFTVALIPFTNKHTNLGALTKGARVNVETDLIARYLDSLRHK